MKLILLTVVFHTFGHFKNQINTIMVNPNDFWLNIGGKQVPDADKHPEHAAYQNAHALG